MSDITAFPTFTPVVTFLDAVDIVRQVGSGNPLAAKQIVAHYVMRSRPGGKPTAVWAIMLLGIRLEVPAPQPLSGELLPNPVVSRMRNIVDAGTGEWISAINLPNLQLVGQVGDVGDTLAVPRPLSPDEHPAQPFGDPGEENLGYPNVELELTSPADLLVVAPSDIIEWTITAIVSTEDNLGLAMVSVDLIQDPLNVAHIEIPPGVTPANMQGFDRPDGISNPTPNGVGSAYGGTQFGTPGMMDLLQIGGGQNTTGVPGGDIGLDVIVDQGVGQEPGGRIIATGSFVAPCTDGLYIFGIESGMTNVLEEVNLEPDYSLVRSAETVIIDGIFSFTVVGAGGQGPIDHRWYVNASAVGNNDGTNWSNAFRNLQDALAVANSIPEDTHEIWVGAGTYYPDRDFQYPNGSGSSAASFELLENVSIYGGFLGIDEANLIDRNPEDNTTILTGALTPGYYFPDCGDPTSGPCDSVHATPGCEDAECCQTVCAGMPECCNDQWDQDCVDLAQGAPPFAPVCVNCGPENSDPGPCDEESSTPGCVDATCCSLVCVQLSFCCIAAWDDQCVQQASQCYATTPARTIVKAIDVGSSAVLNGFTISGSGGGFEGGGILIDDASPRIVRCTLTDNHVECDFDNLEAEPGDGGAMLIQGTSNPTLINCSFIANTACEGGGLHTEARGSEIAEATLINCLFAGNTAVTHGGAIDAGGFDGADLRIINCTFVDNTASDGGGSDNGGGAIWNHRGGTVTITNSILWNNYPDEIKIPVGETGPVVVSFSDVEGGVLSPVTDGGNNIDIDPSFCDPAAGVFGLRPNSACLDAGSDAAVPFDFADLDDDGEPCEPLPWDLSALPRIFDALASASDVDMGAYESQVSVVTCPWDCGNGDVGIRDFLELLGQWGGPGSCDFDGGGVGIIDFLILLGRWGSCPLTECVVNLTIQQELALHCLDQADWDLHEAVMTDPTSSQLKKDRYDCWMRHYLDDCTNCSCTTASCPGIDPFR